MREGSGGAQPRVQVPSRVWLFLLVACLGGCQRQPADNVLFISFDTTRADHLGVYGYSQPTSPELNELAARGAVFERAYSHVPSTLPSHTSMFTGLLPPTHGVRCNGKFVLGSTRLTLAEILSEAGFGTAAILGAFPLERRFGLAQGFDLYDDDFADSILTVQREKGRWNHPGRWIDHDYLDFERRGDEVTERAIRWLRGRHDRWFLFVHYFDPHTPYEPDPPWRELFESPYDGEIAFADHQLGRLLGEVKQLPGRTLIVFTSDHGESLGEHGEAEHNRYVYNATQWVPLIVVLEGSISPGRRIANSVGHIDLLPTILNLLGVKQPSGLPGMSLVPLLTEQARTNSRAVYAETLVWNFEMPRGIEVRSVISDGKKIIQTKLAEGSKTALQWELYDILRDPDERENLADHDPAQREALAELLGRLSNDLERQAAEAVPATLDAASRQRLRNLGYLQHE